MTKNLDNKGLKSIIDNYDIFYIDLWGVVHNGITLHKNAIEALKEITKAKKKYVGQKTREIVFFISYTSHND